MLLLYTYDDDDDDEDAPADARVFIRGRCAFDRKYVVRAKVKKTSYPASTLATPSITAYTLEIKIFFYFPLRA